MWGDRVGLAGAGMTSLTEQYETVCVTPSDIVDHLPRFVAMVEELNAEHVIELGTRTGVSTIAWLYGLGKTGGRLTSIDIDARPKIGEFPHWEFIQGDDCDPQIVGGLDPADIVFIDTSHLYDQTVKELHTYRWLVKPGGCLVLHDTMLERPEGAPILPRFPVHKAVKEFVAETGFELFEFHDSWGLAVIKVV
jgi:cephalosporin hydroxylase